MICLQSQHSWSIFNLSYGSHFETAQSEIILVDNMMIRKALDEKKHWFVLFVERLTISLTIFYFFCACVVANFLSDRHENHLVEIRPNSGRTRCELL